MLKKIKGTGLVLICTGLLTACSNDYAPDKTATGKQIYQEACMSCHKGEPLAPSKMWTLSKQKANTADISEKIKSGGVTMPGFTNMNANDLEKISQFVLENSIIK